MKRLILLLLMNSVSCLSFPSGLNVPSPLSHAIEQIWKDFLMFLRCNFFIFIHPIFASEDPKTNYWLYTQKNPEGCDLQPTAKALEECKFNPMLETKVIVHGWISKFPMSIMNLNFYMKDQYLKDGDFNVVVFNYTAYTEHSKTGSLDYPVSAFRSIFIGLKLSSWIWFLQKNTGVDPKSFHVIGHSLGSEVSAIAGKTTCNLGRLTYLDPAAPIFRYLTSIVKPAYSDAIYTEALHSDASPTVFQGYGYIEPLANIDFYPNGGNDQPKCYKGAHFLDNSGEVETVKDSTWKISCNHYAAIIYFIGSFEKNCHFRGLICDKYEDYQSGKCNENNSQKCEMGYDKINPNLPVHSKCYFRTSDYYPYCLGYKPQNQKEDASPTES